MDITRREALKTATALGVGVLAGADAVPATQKPQLSEAPATTPEAPTLPAQPVLPSQGLNGLQVPHLSSRTCEMPLERHKYRLVALTFSSDGNTLASVGDDGILRLWDVTEEAFLKRHYPSFVDVALACIESKRPANEAIKEAFLVSKKMLLQEQPVLPAPC